MPKCVQFFQDKGHSEDDAKSICYVGFQKRYGDMQNESVELDEENKFYDNARSIYKRFVTLARRKLGKSKTGRETRKDAGTRGLEKGPYVTPRVNTFEDAVKRLVDEGGYPKEDAENIAAKIMFGIRDRKENGVAGRTPYKSKGDEEPLTRDQEKQLLDFIEKNKAMKRESFEDKLDGIFLIEKKKKKSSKRRRRGLAGYPVRDEDEDAGMGGSE
jgi:hypothetical protein